MGRKVKLGELTVGWQARFIYFMLVTEEPDMLRHRRWS